jgi:hypothetical protein
MDKDDSEVSDADMNDIAKILKVKKLNKQISVSFKTLIKNQKSNRIRMI